MAPIFITYSVLKAQKFWIFQKEIVILKWQKFLKYSSNFEYSFRAKLVLPLVLFNASYESRSSSFTDDIWTTAGIIYKTPRIDIYKSEIYLKFCLQ